MTAVRLGAVGYLNARPCTFGLDRDPHFDLRFDYPARCAALLHEGAIDVGLIPSIEYLRSPSGPGAYRIVPGVGIGSSGRVASVALYATRPMADVRSIALDTSSRTSVALTRVMCARAFGIDPELVPHAPDLGEMLDRCDAALLIGDAALLVDHATVRLKVDPTGDPVRLKPDTVYETGSGNIEKIDLGEVWTRFTGLPFVYAFWAGRPDALSQDHVRAMQAARDAGVADLERVAREYFSDPSLHSIGARYLRDNIQYGFGDREQAGLETFYRYAAELGLVPAHTGLRFY